MSESLNSHVGIGSPQTSGGAELELIQEIKDKMIILQEGIENLSSNIGAGARSGDGKVPSTGNECVGKKSEVVPMKWRACDAVFLDADVCLRIMSFCGWEDRAR